MKKNILLVIAGLGNGGAEQQMVNLFQLLNTNGYNCYVLIFNKKEKIFEKFEWLRNDEKFLSLELSNCDSFLPIKVVRGLKDVIVKNDIGMVISFLNVANTASRVAKLILIGKKVDVFTAIRSDYKIQYSLKEKIVENILSPLSKKIFTNSQATRDFLNNKFMFKKKIIYLPNIINCENGQFVQKYSKFTIISVGRLSKEKNYDFLIDVAKELRDKEIDFLVLGDGNEREAIEKRIVQEQLTKIKLIGQVSNVQDYLRKSHLFFMPSLFEGMSNAMIEAICTEIPVYISKNANTSGVIEDGLNGFVFNEYDLNEVAKKISVIYRMDQKEVQKIVLLAKEKIKSEMSSENVMKILKEYI